jgi:hypothetical protein
MEAADLKCLYTLCTNHFVTQTEYDVPSYVHLYVNSLCTVRLSVIPAGDVILRASHLRLQDMWD